MNMALKIVDPKSAPPPAETALRADLARTHEERASAAQRHAAAADVVEHARAFVESVSNEITRLQAVEAEIAARRAASFREALVEAAAPKLTPSTELQRTTAQRLDCENQLAAARDALRTLEADLAQAHARLTACASAVTQAAMRVVGAHADALADKLREAEHATALMRRRLLGATQMRPGGNFPVTSRTFAVLRNDYRVEYARPEESDARHFGVFLARLELSADATPPNDEGA
jgi:hypothetical protein